MITPIQIPNENAVFLATNSLIIEVSTDLNSSHYVEATISLNSGEEIEQIWGRYTPTNIKVDLQNLLVDYFSNEFVEITSQGLTKKDTLIKTVNIVLNEVNNVTNEIVSEYSLPQFYVLNSNEKQSFNSTENIQNLSVLPEIINITKKACIRIPLWLNISDLTVKVYSSTNEIYNENFIIDSKGIYEFDFDFSVHENLSESITIYFSDGSSYLKQYVQFLEAYAYKVEKLYVKNNFNIFEYIELFGKQTSSNSYKRKTLIDYQNIEHQVALEKSATVKIYSQFLLKKQLSLLSFINESTKVLYFKDDRFLPFIVTTKKENGGDSSKKYYEEYIELKQSSFPIDTQEHNYQ